MSQPFQPPSASSTDRPTIVRWHIVALLMGFSFMSWFNRASMAVAADDAIMPEFKISEPEMGTVYSAFFLAYTICMAPGGWLVDRIGPRASLTLVGVGSAIFVALTGIVGLSISSAGVLITALLIVRACMGVFTAPIYPSTGRAVAHWFPVAQRAGANGLVQGSAGVGIALSYVVFGWLVLQFGWRISFVVAGAVTAAWAVFWNIYARNRPSEHGGTNAAERALAADEPGPAKSPAPALASLTSLLRNRSLVFLALSYVAVGYFEYLFIFWSHYYFKEVIELDSTRSKLYAGLSGASFAVGMIIGGWLADRLIPVLGYRWGRATVPIIGMTSSVIALIAATFSQEPESIAAWLAIANGAIGMCEGPVWATAIELGGAQGATAAGICNTGGNAGGMIAPVVTPLLGTWLTPRFGKLVAWRIAIDAAAVVCVIGVALWFWIDASRSNETQGD